MKRAFTLVEIMIVVGLVIILMSLAAPNILRSRIVANEGAALANLKSISNACQMYHMSQDTYPDSLAVLAQTIPPYIDPSLASGSKQRYDFDYRKLDTDRFTINANPSSTGLLKGRYFFIDESGIIHVKDNGPAGTDDTIFQ